MWRNLLQVGHVFDQFEVLRAVGRCRSKFRYNVEHVIDVNVVMDFDCGF